MQRIHKVSCLRAPSGDRSSPLSQLAHTWHLMMRLPFRLYPVISIFHVLRAPPADCKENALSKGPAGRLLCWGSHCYP